MRSTYPARSPDLRFVTPGGGSVSGRSYTSHMVSDPGVVPVLLAEGVEVDVSEWEKATADVLRKAKRLADDAPDSDVWNLLAHQTLDGISVTPLGTPRPDR